MQERAAARGPLRPAPRMLARADAANLMDAPGKFRLLRSVRVAERCAVHRTRATTQHELALFMPRRWFSRAILGPALDLQRVSVSDKAAVLLQGVAENLLVRLVRLARRLSEHHSVHPATERRLEPGDLRLVCAMRLGWHHGDATVDTGLAGGAGGGVARSQQVWSAQGKQR